MTITQYIQTISLPVNYINLEFKEMTQTVVQKQRAEALVEKLGKDIQTKLLNEMSSMLMVPKEYLDKKGGYSYGDAIGNSKVV